MKSTKMLTILLTVVAVLLGSGQEASGGTLVGWGSIGYGLGDVPTGDDFVAIDGGERHSLALKSDGSLAAWGDNEQGQRDVPAGNDFVAIAAGGYHGLALKSDGSVAAWGLDYYGQCDVPLPNSGFVAIAAGFHHSLGLKEDGSVAAWGWNGDGQCDAPAGYDFAAIAGGFDHSFALKSDGSLEAWGYNGLGQCDVPAGNDFVAIAAGDSFSLGLKEDGSVEAWGFNDGGQCDVPAGNDFAGIACGTRHSLAFKSDGSLAAWGIDDGFQPDYGQVTDVPASKDFVAIGCGSWHSLAIAMYAQPMGTGFSYQGRLLDANEPADGLYDFKFELYSDSCTGIQRGSTIDINDVETIEGYFTVALDFGGEVFDGNAVWLEIGVRPGELEDPCEYTILKPRQELTPLPYAMYAQGAEGIGGVIAGSGTANYIAKFTDWNTIGDSVIYEEAGNVGIGTESPSEKLTVEGALSLNEISAPSATSGHGKVYVKSTDSKLYFKNDSGTEYNLTTVGDADWIVSDGNMYSNVSGNVGIGTTSPQNRLDVEGGAVIGAVYSGTETAPSQGLLVQGNVGIGTPTPMAKLEVAGNIMTTTLYEDISLKIGIGTTSPQNRLDVEGGAVIGAVYSGTETAPSQGLLVQGNVGIGTTSPAAKLEVVGDVNVTSSSSEAIIKGTNTGTGSGIRVQANSEGVYGEATGVQGRGVYGRASNTITMWEHFGGYFEAHGAYGRGVFGKASNTGGYTNYGGYFEAHGTNGRGIFAKGGPSGYAGEFEGPVKVEVLEITGGSDLSEQFEIGSEGGEVKPGMVVCIDADNPGELVVSRKACDRTVAGIVSGAGGIQPGMLMGQKGTRADGTSPVALSGRVYALADASYGAIGPGDLLTTSQTPGHAMKVTDHERAQGAVIGKAMTGLEKGKGLVLVLVTLQ